MENNELENLKRLYIQDLNAMISFDGGKTKKKRINNAKLWENFQSIYKSDLRLEQLLQEDSTRNIYVWSDLHFFHKNIIKYCERPFPNVQLMNECLIEHYRNNVTKNDISIWVGDVGFANDNDINELLMRCEGYKILILGNHDFNHGKLKHLDFDEIHSIYHLNSFGIDFVFTHFPMNNLPLPYINIHGHIHNNEPNNGPLQQINVSCEVLNYKPIQLIELVKIANIRLNSIEN